MKLFPFKVSKQHNALMVFLLCVPTLLLTSCATRHVQYGKKDYKVNSDTLAKSPLAYTFYLVGDAGNADEKPVEKRLSFLKNKLGKASSKSTLLFLGDNIYPAGMPKKDRPERKAAEDKLNNQVGLTKGFKGKTVFIPGNHDWYSEGAEGLKRQEKFITEQLGKKAFLPQNGCAIDEVEISDNVALITIDSQWYLENWDENPGMNDDCTIKTRNDFFEELEDKIGKNQTKLTVIAIHHPLQTNGSHGGQYSMKKQLFPLESNFPLPIVGSFINLLRKTSGASEQDAQNKKYMELVKRIKTLIQDKDNIVIVSGHDHNLQYVEKDNVRQVISGAGSKQESARAVNPEDFSYGGSGYAMIQVYQKGESVVTYYGNDGKEEKLLFRHLITPAKEEVKPKEYGSSFEKYTMASVYDEEMTRHSRFYNFFWGKHYRKYYSMKIKARNVTLDTLYGGITPVEAGGGHQSRSLRMEDKSGKQYTMRAIRKSATKFLQNVAFKNQYVERDFRGTYAEDFLQDFYTSSHPYTSFAVDNLSDDIGVAHTNPRLYYVPKQKALGNFNLDFGDELYLVEERPDDGFEKLKSFGKPDAIISTEKVLENLKKDEKYSIDEKAYIRARLFDMLIGDWDRHYDQWRWGEYNNNGKTVYKPIPRDRDQAFPKYGGALLSIALNIPAIRQMKSFKKDIANVKWMNAEPYPLDLALLPTSGRNDWQEQAKYIQQHLSAKEIDEAFTNLPKEVQDGTIDEIKYNLRERLKKLDQYADTYYKVLQKTVLIVGTDKKDKFIINRLANGNTEVKTYRIKKDAEELRFSKIYDRKETNEIWIYGLDDNDVYEVTGDNRASIRLRLLGGLDKDLYDISNGKKTVLYDFKSKENEYKIDGRTKEVLTNDYELNTYDYRKPKYNAVAGYPNAGYNPDDGVKIGIAPTYTVNGFNRNPYSQRHVLKANYYFATKGYEFIYKGIFPNIRKNWSFQMDARYTSPVFAFNFFGYGNETKNFEDEKGMDYNRVKSQTLSVAPSLVWKGESGASLGFQATVESYAVQRTEDRFIATGVVRPEVFNTQRFVGGNVVYSFENYDNLSNPGLGMKFSLLAGLKVNTDETGRKVPYIESAFGLSHRITTDNTLVFATQARTKIIFSNEYEFYQAAAIGGDYDVRAFRSQRFSGKRSFFQSSDLRYEIGKISRSIVPMKYGVLGGFDYGRVWLPGEVSDKWHTAYGGGLWLNGINIVTAKLSYFYSSEGSRVSFGIGFGF